MGKSGSVCEMPEYDDKKQKTQPIWLGFLMCLSGSPTWARTRDLRINSPALYQLSYRGTEERIIGVESAPVKHLVAF